MIHEFFGGVITVDKTEYIDRYMKEFQRLIASDDMLAQQVAESCWENSDGQNTPEQDANDEADEIGRGSKVI